MNKVSIVLAGISGYASSYVNALLDAPSPKTFRVAGMVDTSPMACKRLDDIKAAGIPIYKSLDHFYRENSADLAVISTPIHFHLEHIRTALQYGSCVLCEKPLSATPEEGKKIIDLSSQAKRFVAIGFQWSFSDAIQRLKKDILNGDFGKPLRLKTLVLWPRNKDYFQRSWAGRKYVGTHAVFDSVANNATAHYLHNMLFVMGDRMGTSAWPARVTAELYHANDIENFDTAATRIITHQNVEMLFYASHAVDRTRDPMFHYEFEKADIFYPHSDQNPNITVVLKDGTVRNYGSPNNDPIKKLWVSIEGAATGADIPCTAQTAFPHTLCIGACQQSIPQIQSFPEQLVRYDKANRSVYAEGLYDVLADCYRDWTLPSEKGIAWAHRGREINVEKTASHEVNLSASCPSAP